MPDLAWARRIWAMAVLESLQMIHDRTALTLILLAPAVQILLFGYAIVLEPAHAPVALAGVGTERGGAIYRMLSADNAVTIVASGLAPGGAAARVRGGQAVIGVEIEAPPPEAAGLGLPPRVRLVADGADPAGSAAALEALRERLDPDGAAGVSLERLFNPDRISSWTLAPGLIGVIVMISSLMLGAQSLVREREDGTWESLRLTGVREAEILAGKIAPYILVCVSQAAGTLLLARWAFDLPARGAWGALIAGVPIFAGAHLAFGFAISAAASTRLQAIQGAIFVYLPSILLSGFMFPFWGMPPWARAVGEALPLTHFVRAARGTLLRGAGAELVWREMTPVAIIAVISTVLALWILRRRRAGM